MSTLAALSSVWRAARLSDLESRYAGAGLRVEIEAGPIGLVVYGPDRSAVSRVAAECVAAARVDGDPLAEIEHIGVDDGEPPPTRWVAVVTFDWEKQRMAC